MLSEPAVVVALRPDGATLEADRTPSCAKCELKRGCGQYLLGASGASRIDVDAAGLAGHDGLRVGQSVQLAMTEQGLLVLVALFYLLPLAFLLAAVTAAWWLGLGEIAQICLAVMGLVAGFATGRHLLHNERWGSNSALRIISGKSVIPAIDSGEPAR